MMPTDLKLSPADWQSLGSIFAQWFINCGMEPAKLISDDLVASAFIQLHGIWMRERVPAGDEERKAFRVGFQAWAQFQRPAGKGLAQS